MAVIILDGILDRDDMAVARFVDVIHHRSERRGLTRSGGSGDENQAAGTVQQFAEFIRQSNVAKAQYLLRNLPQHHPVIGFRLQHRHAETRLLAKGEGEIGATLQLHVADVGIRRDGLHQSFRIARRERRTVDRRHAAAQTERRRLADLEVEIGRPLIHHQIQQIIHFIAHGATRLQLAWLNSRHQP